jgi:transposase-like protein
MDMDWETLYCPNIHCHYYGVPFRESLLVKNGTSHGQKQALCRACGSSVGIRFGTAYCNLNADLLIFETAIRALAEGNSLHGTARIVQIDKDTACDFLHRATWHCRLVMLYLWQRLSVSECQLDELWSFVYTKSKTCMWPSCFAKLTAMPGCGLPLHRCGVWSWPLWPANAARQVPICYWRGSRMSRPSKSDSSPATSWPNIALPCYMFMASGSNRSGRARVDAIPPANAHAPRRHSCDMTEAPAVLIRQGSTPTTMR